MYNFVYQEIYMYNKSIDMLADMQHRLERSIRRGGGIIVTIDGAEFHFNDNLSVRVGRSIINALDMERMDLIRKRLIH